MTVDAPRRTRLIWFAIGLATGVLGGVIAAILLRPDAVAGDPVANTGRSQCGDLREVVVYFDTDAEMQRAEESLRGDERVATVRIETKVQAFARFKEIFKDQPELVKLARVEAMPASLRIVPKDLPSRQLADQLRGELAGADKVVGDVCDPPPAPPTT